MKRTKIIILLLLCATAVQARTRKVLFIGNSYVYTNNLPEVLKELAKATGDTLIYDASVPGGQTFAQHVTNPTTLSKIKSDKWDVVILQEQSQRPAFSPGQVQRDVYPYARILDSLVRDNNPCSETMFYMTWGRKNGDQGNCTNFPPVCTYDGMQQRLRESYTEMAKDNNALLAPVGSAWKLVRDNEASIELYSADESHPSVSGTYLAACVIYAGVFHRSPMNNPYNGGLSGTEAGKLQYYAAKVAVDSQSQLQQHGNYTAAAFGVTVAGKKITLQNKSAAATTYKWEFGDGNTSIQASPTHTYGADGSYTVKLTASNNCFSETVTQTVNIGAVGIGNVVAKEDVIRVSMQGSGKAVIHILQDGYTDLQVYSVNGQYVTGMSGKKGKIEFTNLTPGIHVYKLTGDAGQVSGIFSIQ